MVDICEHGLVERLQREGGQRNDSHGHHLRCAGHHDFIENMITGGSQADVVLIMVPAAGNFTTCHCQEQPQSWRDSRPDSSPSSADQLTGREANLHRH